MNKEISLLSQTYKLLSNAAPPQNETAAREFYEGLKALEYAVWCLENSQAVTMGSPKQVIRIFPEFSLWSGLRRYIPSFKNSDIGYLRNLKNAAQSETCSRQRLRRQQ